MKNSYVILLLSVVGFYVVPAFAEKMETLIPNAVQSGDVEEVKVALGKFDKEELKNYISLRDENGKTPLYWAVIASGKKGVYPIVTLLLKNGALKSINEVDEDGITPLYWAAYFNQKKIFTLLLLLGANITDKVKELISMKQEKNEKVFTAIKGLINGSIAPTIDDLKKKTDFTEKELKEFESVIKQALKN